MRTINERYVNTQAISNSIEHGKHTLIYFYDDEHVSLHYKALSNMEWLLEDFYFAAVYKPTKLAMNDYMI